MKKVLCAVAVAVVAAGAVTAGETQFKPVDTDKLVRKPTKMAAALSAATIGLVGNTAASSADNNGYIKTINNLFGFKRWTAMPTQAGPSRLPTPTQFSSTQYKSYNNPVMPISVPRR